jgi:hypothetical protein
LAGDKQLASVQRLLQRRKLAAHGEVESDYDAANAKHNKPWDDFTAWTEVDELAQQERDYGHAQPNPVGKNSG